MNVFLSKSFKISLIAIRLNMVWAKLQPSSYQEEPSKHPKLQTITASDSIIGNSSTRHSEETSLGALYPFLKQRLAFLKQHLLGPTSHPPKSITSTPLLGSFLLDYIRACCLGSIRMIIGYSSAITTINVKLLSLGSSKTIFLAASSSSASCIPSYIRN